MIPRFFNRKKEEEPVEYTEISSGDIERIDQIKEWLKQGKNEKWAENKLREMGYIHYHIDFLMRKATGRKEPKLPEDLIQRKEDRKKYKIRLKYEIITIIICVGILYLFSRLGAMGTPEEIAGWAIQNLFQGIIRAWGALRGLF